MVAKGSSSACPHTMLTKYLQVSGQDVHSEKKIFEYYGNAYIRGAFGKFEQLSCRSYNIHSKTQRNTHILTSTYPL